MSKRVVEYLGRHHWGILATFIALGGTGYAATALPASDRGIVHACVDKAGAVRIVTSGHGCHRNERAVAWSQTGPVGPSDGYFSSKGKITLPPGDYIAYSACTEFQSQPPSPTSAPLVFGEAESVLSTDPTPLDPLSPPPTDGTESFASVPNQGTNPSPGGIFGSASLSNVASFHLPNGGTIYGVCAPVPSIHGFGGSAVDLASSNADVTAIRVGSLHTG